MNPVPPCFVRGRRDHTADVGAGAHDDGTPTVFRMVPHLDRREKRVHVDVGDEAGGPVIHRAALRQAA
jgi:hypothetical protein